MIPKHKDMIIVSPIAPAQIRKTRTQRVEEQRIIKLSLRSELLERGDIAHIHKLMNEISPINYASVSYALNPKHRLWSPRVIEFVKKYIETRESLKNKKSE